ncbi:hypothetical protein ACFXJB_50660, partial [Streptomyces mirabilis]
MTKTKAVRVSLLPVAVRREAFAEASAFRGEFYECLTARRGLAVLRAGTEPLVVSGSLDGTIQLWDPARDDTHDNRSTDQHAEHVTLLPQQAGPPRLISGYDANTVTEISPTTGRTTPYPHDAPDLPGHHITALAAPDHASRYRPTPLAVGYSDGSLRILTEEGDHHVLQTPFDRTRRTRRSHARTLLFLPTAPSQPPVLAAGFSNSCLVYYTFDDEYALGRVSKVDLGREMISVCGTWRPDRRAMGRAGA